MVAVSALVAAAAFEVAVTVTVEVPTGVTGPLAWQPDTLADNAALALSCPPSKTEVAVGHSASPSIPE